MATLDSLTFEFSLGGATVDATDYVMGEAKFTITRGEADEYGRLRPSMCSFSLNNSSGIWSNDNPASPYFGLLVPGVEVTISRGSNVRGTFQVQAWPQEWHYGENVAFVPVRASGPLDNLTQGQRSLESPIFRDVMRKPNDQYRLAYWPMEGESANGFVSPMPGVQPMETDNFELITLNSFESFGSRNLPVWETAARATGIVPTHASTNEYKVVIIWNVPAAITDLTVMARLEFTGGTIGHVDLVYGTIAGGSLKLSVYDTNSALIDEVGFIAYAVDGKHFLNSIEFVQSGTSLQVGLLRQGIQLPDTTGGGLSSETYTQTMGTLRNVLISPFGTLDGVAVGHVGVSNDIAGLAALADATIGHYGETAGDRFYRLLAEEGFSGFVGAGGALSLTETMGIQGRDTLINLLNECLTVDQGVIRENRIVYGVTYVPGYTLNNQSVTVALDYAQGHLWQRPQSTFDNFLVHNDVTVRTPDGDFARYEIPEGRLSVNAPPDGIGTYDRGPVTANIEDADHLADLASYIANVRSPLDRRWTRISVELARSDVDADLRDDILNLNCGNEVMSLANMPMFVAPETHYGIVRGWKETGDKFTHSFDFYTTPYWPYEVEPVETSGSTLTIAYSTGATSLLLATSDGPLWDTTYEPYHIQAGGEAMRVTAMADNTATLVGAGTPDHDDNATVTPGFHASTANGDLVVLIAAIRNTAATITTPAGWSVDGTMGNFVVYSKYYDAATVAPSVAFSGGAAGDTTSGVILTFRGLSRNDDQGRYLATNPSPQSSTNVSAQNIAYSGVSVREAGSVVLVAAWKQDDYTSIAPNSGFTESVEASTTTGNDQSLYAMHQIMGSTPSDVFADSIVVTGGAAAISRAITLVYRITQTATVTRGVNGVNVAQSAGAAVTTWRLGVNAL